jgi:hypothetical protein
MTPVSKVLLAAAVLCFVIWGATINVGLQPLVAVTGLQVIYGEGEEFFSDAVAYRKVRTPDVLILHLPHARPAYRWWAVDFRNETIMLSAPARSFRRWHYMLRVDVDGVNITDETRFPNWYWHFTAGGASVSGSGFTCSVKRPAK